MARKKKTENVNVEVSENFVKKKRTNRKKAEKQPEPEFVPSKYQEAIFDRLLRSNKNIVIEACSGSGKTTTILKCIDYMPFDAKILFAAFNKDIVNTIKKKLGKDSTATVRTIHSLGYSLLANMLGTFKLAMNEFKYTSYMFTREFKRKIIYQNRKVSDKIVMSNCRKLFNFSRCNLANSDDAILALAEKYDINLVANEEELVLDLMEYGKSHLDDFDFTDLIWLPNVLETVNNSLKFDYVIVDEVQDVNRAQLKLILSCFKMGTRGIFVGDSNQLIYGFTGTDTDSFNEIRNLPNTEILPLSISYRCPKKVINFVHRYVAEIEPKENAIDGEIIRDGDFDDIGYGDAVICRNNAPLIKAYALLTDMGKEPIFNGRELSDKLIDMVRETGKEMLNVNLRGEGVFSVLFMDLENLKHDLMNKYGINEDTAMGSSIYMDKVDMLETLMLLVGNLRTADELIDKIRSIFNKKEGNVILTTAHKSKGLEFENVYIIYNNLFNKKKKTDWETRQEKNLAYVAYTRTKNKLVFVDNHIFDEYDKRQEAKDDKRDEMEGMVNRMYKGENVESSPKADTYSSDGKLRGDVEEDDVKTIVVDFVPKVMSDVQNCSYEKKGGIFSLADRKRKVKRDIDKRK